MGQVGENLDLTLRSPVTTRDEIGRASETFNGLLERLQGAFTAVLEGVGRVRQSSVVVNDTTQNIVVNATARPSVPVTCSSGSRRWVRLLRRSPVTRRIR
jgi:methyl-accepting chemotaxis protein